jgi:hypothetical protein
MLNRARRLVKPISVNSCNQKTNPARETVPLKYWKDKLPEVTINLLIFCAKLYTGASGTKKCGEVNCVSQFTESPYSV